jgi:hypothetical protein
MSKAKLKKVLDNHSPESKNIHDFYDRVIKLSSNLSNRPFPRKEPSQNWSVYKTEEEYEESLKSSIEFSKKFDEKQKKSFDTIIYNGNNSDGVFSGYIAWKYLKDNKKENIELIPLVPDFRQGISRNIENIKNKIEGRNVLMVDLYYNKDTNEYIKNISKFFINLDNHYDENVKTLDYVFITKKERKDKGHGAVAATWKFFYPDKNVPYLFQSIDSADVKLYLKYLPDPNPILVALDVKFVKNQYKNYKNNPEKLMLDIEEFLNKSDDIKVLNFISILGQVMDRFAENMKNEIVSKKSPKTLKTPKGNKYPIVVLNYSQPGLVKRIMKNMAETSEGRLALIYYYDFNKDLLDISISTNHRPGVENPLHKIKSDFGFGSVEGDTLHLQIRNTSPGDISKYII